MIANYIKSLFHKSGLYSAGNLFQQIINIVLIPIYTAFLSTEDYGIIGLMTMTAGIILQITKTPVAHGFVRYYFLDRFKEKQKELLFSSIIFALINSSIFFVIFFSFSNSISLILLDSSDYNTIVIIYAFIILLQPLEDISQDLIKVQKKAGLYFIHQIIMIITSAALILFLLFNDYGVMSVIWGNLYLALFPFLFFFPVILKNIELKFNTSALKPLLKYGYPMIPASISIVLLQMIDHYILRYYHDVSTVGLYTFGYKFGGLIGFLIILPIQNILHPMLLEFEKDKSKLQEFFSESVNVIYYISAIACLGLSVFAKEVIFLMSSNAEFYPAWKFVPIIAFAYVHFGLSEILGKGIILAKKTTRMSITVVSAAIINITLNILLIPHYDVYGAAIATLLSFVFLDFANYYYSKKLHHLRVNFRKIYLSSLMLILLIALSYFIDTGTILIDVSIKLIIIFSYIFFIFVIADRQSKNIILSFLNKKI